MTARLLLAAFSSLALVLVAPSISRACGEGLFHMGDGLRFQGYLAPRPATVLVFDDDRAPPEERIRVYRGLVQAGHRLTVAHDPAELAQAMQERRFDVVIADLAAIDLVAAAAPSALPAPRLLPVVEGGRRQAEAGGDRFAAVVGKGASLGQYLRRINSLMRD